MGALYLVSPIPPSVNHYLKARAFIVWRGGKPKPQITVYETAEAKEYKNQFSDYAMHEVVKQKWNIENTRDRLCYLDCIFYFPRVDMDDNNYYKCLCDALNNVAFIDDNKVKVRTQHIYYDSDNPRIEMMLHLSPQVGIFDTKDVAEHFTGACQSCKRHKRNCSILNDAMKGKIRKELTRNDVLWKCTKHS